MPELPDVETFRRYLNYTSLRQKIKNVRVRDKSLLSGVSSRTLQTKMKGKKFSETSRRGKFMFAKFDSKRWLVLHFGMTGFLKYYKDEDKQPGHARVIFDFSNGYHLAYDNMRKLGRVGLTTDLDKFARDNDLGPDVYSPDFDFRKFREILSGKRGTVKSALMDQSSMAGIGNIYSDEMLFQAGIFPGSSTEKLDDRQAKRLFREVKRVLKKAVEVKADPSKMPRNYLLPKREQGARCPKCGGKIKSKKISGRTSYYCTKHQKHLS
jgi:formamidopyrimidine-DNA glycosylase